MPKVFTSKTQKTGELGEQVACNYLSKKGFTVIERNYTKKWGEIDIIAKKGSVAHFVEVKTKTLNIDLIGKYIDSYKPEDGMHFWKQQRLARTIQTYLLERRIDSDWQFDLLLVYLDPISKQARIQYMENIIL